MAPTLKDRSGRLQAFARGTPEAATPQNHSHDHTHRNRKRSETPQAAVPTAPSRQELVDSAKLPIPKNGRYASPHQRDGSVASQPLPPQSPPRVRDPSQIRRPRAGSHDRQDARDPHEALFNGSQLSEGFMNSGLTTPQNEREDPGLEAAHRIKKSPAPHNVHPLFRTQFEPAARSSEDAAFLVGDDGFMTVISASGRHAPPNMKDGFHDVKMNDHGTNGEPHRNGNQLPTSPVERQAKLPVREVKVRRANSNRREDPSLPDEPRVLSPTLESSRWQARNKSNGGERPTLFRDVDLEIDSYAELEPHTTPKGPKAKAPPQRTLMESSMPVTSASRNEPREKKRRRGSLDYDDKALSSMAYEQLLQEDFDYDPAAVAAQSNSGSKSDDYASVLTRFLQQSEKEQRNMFANMSIKDWELSGDWFIDQFADLMHRLRDARQNKRRIVRKFEDEIAHREEMVRLRSEVIDRKLVKMKQDGQRVVEDKEL